jgi:hypothetical protein
MLSQSVHHLHLSSSSHFVMFDSKVLAKMDRKATQHPINTLWVEFCMSTFLKMRNWRMPKAMQPRKVKM